MRMTPVTITFRDHEWEFIMDALAERCLGDIEGDRNVVIATATRLVREIERRVGD